jgi:hypothetical protein
MNCMGKRNFGEIGNLSPKKLDRARMVAASQKPGGMLSTSEDKTKAASMPIPPPFGIGTTWELLSFG